MRENRPYGSEGGAARKGRPYPYPGAPSTLFASRIEVFVSWSLVSGLWSLVSGLWSLVSGRWALA